MALEACTNLRRKLETGEYDLAVDQNDIVQAEVSMNPACSVQLFKN